MKIQRPSCAKSLENQYVGQCVHYYDTECGLSSFTIVSIDNDGFPLICELVPEGRFDVDCPVHVHYLNYPMFPTKIEAMRAGAIEAIEYIEPRLAFAKRLLAAIDDKCDVTEFRDGHDLD